MDYEFEQSSSPPPAQPEKKPRAEHSEALLQSAIERLKARGDSARRFACMSLPAPAFNDLCARLLDRAKTVKETAEWLAGQVEDAPTRSSVERFSDALFEEYRLAQLADRRRAAETYVAQATAGDPDAQQMALNTRLTELLTDELLRADDAGEIETKRLMALMMGARTVAQTAFDKQKMDVRIQALEKQIVHRDKTILLMEQRLAKLPEQVKAISEKLTHVEQAQAQGKKVDPAVYAAIRAELTRVKEAA